MTTVRRAERDYQRQRTYVRMRRRRRRRRQCQCRRQCRRRRVGRPTRTIRVYTISAVPPSSHHCSRGRPTEVCTASKTEADRRDNKKQQPALISVVTRIRCFIFIRCASFGFSIVAVWLPVLVNTFIRFWYHYSFKTLLNFRPREINVKRASSVHFSTVFQTPAVHVYVSSVLTEIIWKQTQKQLRFCADESRVVIR